MAEVKIDFGDLKDGQKVTLRLRDEESVIVGTVDAGFTAQGGRRVSLTNNRNSVVLYRNTNFRIFAERTTINEVLAEFSVGTVFEYISKYGVRVRWVKSGDDRVTRVDDGRPAYSLSISEGFTDQPDSLDRLTLIH